jgi:hypothetical protein
MRTVPRTTKSRSRRVLGVARLKAAIVLVEEAQDLGDQSARELRNLAIREALRAALLIESSDDAA